MIEIWRQHHFQSMIYQTAIVAGGLHAVGKYQISVRVSDGVDGEVDLFGEIRALS
jgi:hypothetical protein